MKKSAPTNAPNQSIRIVYAGTCPKLTSRGSGDLSYELGVNEATGDGYVRISANASSGAYSNEWLSLTNIRTLLDLKQGQPFSSVAMKDLFTRRSANNYGYLAAVLIAEKVLTALPGKPVLLTLGTWATVEQKIKKLKDQGVSLTDHIAIANMQKRALLVANMRPGKTAKDAKEVSEAEKQSPPTGQ